MVLGILEVASVNLIYTIIIIFILKVWFKTRLEESIKHDYDKKLEEFKFETRKREQAALVADLFSKWIDVEDPIRDQELNKLSFEISLWLPDELAIEINKRLKNLQDAKPTEDLLIECRKLIQNADTKMDRKLITFFGLKKR